MPVGKVFNAAENQVLISPVTNYYKGEINRANLKAAEQEAEIRAMEIANAPSKMQAAIDKAKLDEEKIRLAMEKTKGEISANDLARRKEVYGPVLEAAKKKLDENGDVDLDWVNKEVKAAVKRMGPEEEERFKKNFAGSDNVLNHEEFARFGLAHGIQQEIGDRTAQKFIDRDGNPVQGSMDKQGNYFDSSGTQRTDITPIAPAATQEDLGLGGSATDSDTVGAKVREVMGATDNLIDSMDRIITLSSRASQASLGLPGTVSGLVDRSISAAIGFAEIAKGWAEIDGQEVDNRQLLDTRLYENLFSEESGMNAAMKANAVGVAFALARAANPDGRLSDKDVAIQLDRLGLNQSSKVRIAFAISEVKRESYKSAMNWLRTTGATDVPEGRAAFSKYATALEILDDPTASQNTGPEVGFVKDGYKFTGGDPGDKKNWTEE